MRLEACARITRAVARSPAAARRTSVSGSASSSIRCGQSVRQRQRLAGQRGRAIGVVVQRGGGVAHERGEPDAVDLGRVDAEPVAGGVAHDRVRRRSAVRVRETSTCRLFVALAGASSPQTRSISRSLRTGRPPAAASAASSACERSPATGAPRQRTSPSSVKATVTGQVYERR